MSVEEQFLILGTLYFIPTIAAWLSNSAALGAVFGINLFFGWTGLGWLACWIIMGIAPDKKQLARNQKVAQARDEFYLREQAKYEATQPSPAALVSE